MSLTTADLAHILISLALLLLAAHFFGRVFGLLHQPPVVGEIIGGLLMGPTVLGLFAPAFGEWMFPSSGITAGVLGAVYQIGLLLLMFLVGAELEVTAVRGKRRTVALVTVIGLIVPFTIGIFVARFLDVGQLNGPHGSTVTFGLVFGIAIAVTSIPVISRILMDLGLLDTTFAHVVLTVAVLEDVVLYVILAVALGLGQAGTEDAFGLWTLTGIDAVGPTAAYHVAASLFFLGAALLWGTRTVRALTQGRLNLVEQQNPTAFRLLVLFGATLACMGLGINPIFGALVAGIACSRAAADRSDEPAAATRPEAWASLKQFSMAFFIPVYFAIVGLKLDLVKDLNPVFMCWFFMLACVTKALAVWVAARLAGEDRRSANNFAVALNARGGPGIVLATVTLSAGLISEEFFTALILLSIFTSQIAGYWLYRVFVRSEQRLAPGKWTEGAVGNRYVKSES
jgi:Kef-type K+ transport system membrane component KefB